jgi:membrane peptidoglycan carboxypeptidase
VKDAHGHVILRTHPPRKRVVPAGIAAVANDVLQGVVQRGTGVRARMPRPVAGKTGTAQGFHDAWFVGYTPNFAAAVWMGVATGEVSMTPENGFPTVIAGGTFPAEVWREFASDALLGKPAPAFPTPAGESIQVDVDIMRNCLPNRWTPANQVEHRTFLAGTEPTQTCVYPTGPPPTRMPSVLVMPQAEAKQRLENRGFRVVEQASYDASYAAGTVIGQNPASGQPVTPGETITLTIASTSGVDTVVPDLLGDTAAAATKALAGVGLVADIEIVPSCSGPSLRCAQENQSVAGHAWRQNVAAGTSLPVGTHVRVSVGPSN